MLFLKSLFFLVVTLLFSSCSGSDIHQEDGKIFHAGSAAQGIGGIYFSLYNDHTYQICETGGLGQTCYNGNYSLKGDTITLLNLDKECYLKNNRLVICRYKDQDSSYWQWKYPNHKKDWTEMTRMDTMTHGSIGDVHQIDNRNRRVLDPTYYFVISMDSVNYYH